MTESSCDAVGAAVEQEAEESITCSGGNTRDSPRLLKSLKKKRDFLRTQFSQLQKTFADFKLPRSPRLSSKDARPQSGLPESGLGLLNREQQSGGDRPAAFRSDSSLQAVGANGDHGSHVGQSAALVSGEDSVAWDGLLPPVCRTSGAAAGQCFRMTVRGEGWMENSHSGTGGAGQTPAAVTEHNHHHATTAATRTADGRQNHQAATVSSLSAVGSKRVRRTSELSEDGVEYHQEENGIDKVTEVDDELPLGSEANSLNQDQHRSDNGVVVQPPVDKRLLSLRYGFGAATGGGANQLLHSGWTSFNSDLSNLTSGSANSANSLDVLLQERQVDPEQVLLNLGFGGSGTGTTAMYARVPDRFLVPQEVEIPQDEGSNLEAALPEGASRRTQSRGLIGWERARLLSTTMQSLKMFASLQHGSPLAMYSPLGPSSLTASSSSLTASGHPRSILHPDNQRALARQGFYGDNPPEGIDPKEVPKRVIDHQGKRSKKGNAQDRRMMFHKTRSRRHRSLVESGGDEGDTFSQESIMKSADFSTTTESTDSGGELSTSAPTTPGDVFMDRSSSPFSATGHSGSPAFPTERLPNIDDLYLPDRGLTSSSVRPSRQKLTEKLMAHLDNDDSYFVSPPSSRQHTVEKATTLTDDQSEIPEDDLDGVENGTELDPASEAGVSRSDLKTKSVTIVVSGDGRMQRLPSPVTTQQRAGSGMNFLSIVSAAVDRFSDSGSDHTLMDHQSSSSGSPRPPNDSESSRPCFGANNAKPANDSEIETDSAQILTDSRSPRLEQRLVSRQVPQGPVLYVYHKVASNHDENDNVPVSAAMKGVSSRVQQKNQQNPDEDLPRMSSIQSDSSGFGDAEITVDNATHEMAFLKVGSLGSSCESSTTMASTCTVTGGSHTHINNGFYPPSEATASQSGTYLQQDLEDAYQTRADDLPPPITSSFSGTDSERRYVTMCYIPSLNRKRTTGPSSKATGTFTSTVSAGVAAPSSSIRTVLPGKIELSVMLRDKVKKGRAPPASGEGFRKNERPLSEELAQASLPLPGSSQGAGAWMPRLALQRPTQDSDSAELRQSSSGDEVERDSRSQSYGAWNRQPHPSAYPSKRARQRFFPAAEGEEGEGESGASVEGSSVYSCASTSDSIASSSSSELLDCHKLMKLINQPTMFKGRKTHLVKYQPKRHLRDWPCLVKKKKLQEETRLAQYAMQKYKTELSIMETTLMVKYQMAFEDTSREERDDVEELQHLWAEVRRQVMETEQLLMSRMKMVASGNDNFSSLASINVLQRMIDLLKEQIFQKQVASGDGGDDEQEEEEDEDWEEPRRGGYRQRGYSARLPSWADYNYSPRLRGRHFASTSHLPVSPVFSDASYEQMRSSLMSEIQQEMRSSLQSLQLDLHKRDNEIHRLQLQLMLEQGAQKSKPTPSWSRSLPGYSKRRRGAKETDV